MPRAARALPVEHKSNGDSMKSSDRRWQEQSKRATAICCSERSIFAEPVSPDSTKATVSCP